MKKKQSFHPFQQSSQCIKVYRVGVDVEQSAVAVDEPVGGITFHSDKFFDGVLLLVGQVVVIPRLVLTRYPTEIIISRLYIVISRLTMRFPSCRTCRNFRHVDISFNLRLSILRLIDNNPILFHVNINLTDDLFKQTESGYDDSSP